MLEFGMCKGTVVRHVNWSKVTFNRLQHWIMTKEGPGRDYGLGVFVKKTPNRKPWIQKLFLQNRLPRAVAKAGQI